MTKIAFSKAKKIAMKFFGSEMTPPPFGNFPEIHPFWWRQGSLKCDFGPRHSQFLQCLRGELSRHSAESGLGGDGLESFGKGWGCGVYKGVGVKAFGPPRANLLSTTLLLCSPAFHSALQICSLKLQRSATALFAT